MIRFAYLIPRLIIIALIALALFIGSDPLVRKIVTAKLENATGAKVEIGQLRSSLMHQKVFLKDIAIADPRSPMKNLIQAELAFVEFDAKSLLHRNVVIEKSQMSGVMFGVPRSETGQLDSHRHAPQEAPDWTPKTFQTAEQLGRRWLDQLPGNNSPEKVKFELNQTIEGMNRFWGPEFVQLLSQIKTLQQDSASLRATVNPDPTNTLRTKFVNSEVHFKAIATRTQQIQNRLYELQQTAAANREALTRAYQRDIQQLRQSTEVPTFDSAAISQLLLAKSQEKQIGEIIRWFHWFRESIPDSATDFQMKPKRGEDLLLARTNRKPGFLIKAMDMEGEGRLANRHFNFAGTAYNITPQPKNHDQPTTFELRAQGDQHVVVSCTLDRRGQDPIDSLKIICPDLKMDAQLLGDPESMLVTMGAGNRVQADIQISAIGDQLSGKLIFRHTDVTLHVDQLHEMAGGKSVALQMNQGLISVDRFESRVTLSGTVKDYQYQFKSDLGNRFANSVNTLLTQKGDTHIAETKRALDRQLATQLQKLESDIVLQIQQLAQLLHAESNELAELKELNLDNALRRQFR